jgi:lysophospholipase L1-like esterase
MTGENRLFRITRRLTLFLALAALFASGAVLAVAVSGAHASAARAVDKSYDLNGDGVVDSADVAILQSYYGQPATTPGAQAADLNSDGVVNVVDLSILLSHFGPVPTPATTPSSTALSPTTVVTPTQSPTTQATTTSGSGATVNDDINRDGVIDSRDLDALKSYYGKTLDTLEAHNADLNGDGVVDIVDLSIFLSHLPSGTTLPTSTSTAVNDDINRDGVVDSRDLDVLKSYYGKPLDTPEAHNADLNGDGVVNIVDLSIFLSNLSPGTTFPTTTQDTPTVPPSTVSTFAETEAARSGVRTFANYHNASVLGPLIGYRQVVQVSCKVKDGTIKSVNPDGYWYRIASPPWNNAYYAPANVFLNGDPPNGPYSRNTDFSVPDCGSSALPKPTSPVAPPTTNTALPPPSSTKRNHLWIVTLGDSYTAGNGAGANYDSCRRSYNSYAWLYMNRIRGSGSNADIWQRACSGNVTTDVGGQISDVVNNSPVGHNADLVFMTIGGNDLSFSNIVQDCLFNVGYLAGGCSYRLDNAVSSIDDVVGRTKGILKDAAQRFPQAQIVLIGYPSLTHPRCPRTQWNDVLAEAQDSFDTSQATMVKLLNRSQGTNRFHFISVAQTFSGHGPCAALSTQYVRGVGDLPDWPWFHPNAAGNQVIANLLYADGVQNW